MNGKQNRQFQECSPVCMTYSLKPHKNYLQVERSNHSIKSIQASPVKFPKYSQPAYFKPNDIPFSESRAISGSIHSRFKSMHLSSVHELIANARQKKSEIQDLLRCEENKAQNEEQDAQQICHSLQKLKKVLRLLQIVCKMINSKNSPRDSSCFLGLSLERQCAQGNIHSQQLQNLEHQIKVKDSQICRLKKLVEVLSVPENSMSRQIISQSHLSDHISFSPIPHQNKYDPLHHPSNKTKQNNFSIEQTFSVWNICDAQNKETKKEQINQSYDILKQMKSVIKVSVNSLNFLIRATHKWHPLTSLQKLNYKIIKFANFFNIEYSKMRLEYSKQTMKEIVIQLKKVYENVRIQIDELEIQSGQKF